VIPVSVAEVTRDELQRLDALVEEQERIFLERQPGSARTLARARRSLAGGTTSNWQIARPQAVWLSHGSGSHIYDVDGNRYADFHGGYGVMAVGHAHPRVVEAVRARVERGTHFAQPTEDALIVAEELRSRFGLPLWRFCNSGTEATMDAVHLARAVTGRDAIVKVEGCYHGHHDSVQVSVIPEPDEMGSLERPLSSPSSSGIPRAITDLTLVVPFNDADALARRLREIDGGVAAVIVEPIMMNAGIIPPDPGYIAAVKELAHEAGALLVFDEVKTGVTVARGGATEVLGVTPDIICLAKAIGGGLPCGAIGGTEEIMDAIASGLYEQVGTFNGNPLTMAAARATLTEVLTPRAYERFDTLRSDLVAGCERVIAEHDLGAYTVAFGAKGCITFSRTRIRSYRDFLAVDDRYSHCHWLFQHNGGVFLPPWGKAEQWMLSVQHREEDIALFVDNFSAFARALRS
jgi:glutamate-1-semialdehyde 2,1-aminomutase